VSVADDGNEHIINVSSTQKQDRLRGELAVDENIMFFGCEKRKGMKISVQHEFGHLVACLKARDSSTQSVTMTA
jgi:hypothetical protein